MGEESCSPGWMIARLISLNFSILELIIKFMSKGWFCTAIGPDEKVNSFMVS